MAAARALAQKGKRTVKVEAKRETEETKKGRKAVMEGYETEEFRVTVYIHENEASRAEGKGWERR